MTCTTRFRRLARILGAALLALAVVGPVGAGPAHAINPPQTTVRGTAEVLYPWVNYFSYHVVASQGRAYVSPKVFLATAAVTDYGGGCVFRSHQIAGHCSGGRHEIYLHVGENQAAINRRGDYAAGSTLAHEFGHHIAESLGLRLSTMGSELYADCMAGAFSRYAYANRLIDMTDVYEGYHRVDDYADGAGGYPTNALRKGWYAWGFNTYDVAGCAAHAARA